MRRGSPAPDAASTPSKALCFALLVLSLACHPGAGTVDAPLLGGTPHGAPALTGDSSLDSFNWVNYRREQLGLPLLARNAFLDAAAQGHSVYQRDNNGATHAETPGLPGFLGATIEDRLRVSGYRFPSTSRACAESVLATTSYSGFFASEALITQIYGRFIILEPTFAETGAGWATASGGLSYATMLLVGSGPGVAPDVLVTYPASNQTSVQAEYDSDAEVPDPMPNQTTVGFPISVHVNASRNLTVASFTVTTRGGASPLTARLLTHANDVNTPASAAAIVPLAGLRSATVYDVSFAGAVDGLHVFRDWSFTTR